MKSSFIRSIYDKKNSFTPTDDSIAAILIKKYNILDKLSIQEIANWANCTKPMVTNFCKKLGLTGFKQLKKLFIVSNHRDDNEFSKIGIIKSLQTTNDLIKCENIELISMDIVHASKVHVISSGFLKWIGYLLVERMNKLGINAEYIYDKYDFTPPIGDSPINLIISNTGMNNGINEFVEILYSKKLANKKNTWTISLNNKYEWKNMFPKSIIGFSHNEELSFFRKTLPMNSINVILHILNIISLDVYHLIQKDKNNKIKGKND